MDDSKKKKKDATLAVEDHSNLWLVRAWWDQLVQHLTSWDCCNYLTLLLQKQNIVYQLWSFFLLLIDLKMLRYVQVIHVSNINLYSYHVLRCILWILFVLAEEFWSIKLLVKIDGAVMWLCPSNINKVAKNYISAIMNHMKLTWSSFHPTCKLFYFIIPI